MDKLKEEKKKYWEYLAMNDTDPQTKEQALPKWMKL